MKLTARIMQKRLPRIAYPLASERQYRRAIYKAVDALVSEIEATMSDALSAIKLDDFEVYETVGEAEEIRQWLVAVGISSAPYFEEAVLSAVKSGNDVAKMTREQLTKLLKSFYGIDIFLHEPDLAVILKAFEAENLRLIKSIPRQYLDGLYSKVVNALQAGTSKKGLITIVRETYPVPKKRAKLIARDQIGKIHGNLTRARQQAIGVESYLWRTSKDERVRGNPAGRYPRAKYSHHKREGETFSWEAPPPDGNPGHAIQCRCYAEPVLPLLQDLKGVIINGNEI